MTAKIEQLRSKQESTKSNESPETTFEMTGRVKWFNTVKGFGFLTPNNEPGDIFLHLSCLRESGHEYVAEGVSITCVVVRRSKGLQAIKVLDIDTSTAVPFEPRVPEKNNVTTHPAVQPQGDFVEVRSGDGIRLPDAWRGNAGYIRAYGNVTPGRHFTYSGGTAVAGAYWRQRQRPAGGGD